MKQGDMSWKLFKNIVTPLPSSTVIVPFFRGESLLHLRFNDFLNNLGRFQKVQLATNGDYLTPQKEKAILQNTTFLSVSLHNFAYPDRQSFLNTFLQCGNNGITTQVSILDTLIPYGLKKKFVSDWLKHVDRVRIYMEHSHNGYGDTHLKIQDDGSPCSKPFNEMVVYWNGKVALCCHDWNNTNDSGDLNKQTIHEVWNGQYYKNVRWLHENGRRRDVGSCVDCDQWKADYMPNKILGELYEGD